jgi:hypothetical protein
MAYFLVGILGSDEDSMLGWWGIFDGNAAHVRMWTALWIGVCVFLLFTVLAVNPLQFLATKSRYWVIRSVVRWQEQRFSHMLTVLSSYGLWLRRSLLSPLPTFGSEIN